VGDGGGGGTSTGGVYSVSGTIGQPGIERTMTKAQYSIIGGFRVWLAGNPGRFLDFRRRFVGFLDWK
jgi:hypothetical protein